MEKLGLRYERLLMLTAPISLACILVAFIASASEQWYDERRAACLQDISKIVIANRTQLDLLWQNRLDGIEATGQRAYATTVVTLAKSAGKYDCASLESTGIEQDPRRPFELSEQLLAEAKRIRAEIAATPLRSWGIEFPASVTLDLFGAKIVVTSITLTKVLQLLLAPVLVLWFGSLYNTRFRETLMIERAAWITQLYPHPINIYMTGQLPPLRKHSRSNHFFTKYVPYLPAVWRSCLLAVFLMPPVVFYWLGIFSGGRSLGWGNQFSWFVGAGMLVAYVAVLNLMAEFNPWHARKTFPGPRQQPER